MASVTHIAGPEITIGGRRMRQRCSWCGATLIDYDLTRVAVQVRPGEEPRLPGTWEVGRLVRVDAGNPTIGQLLEPTDELPDDACGHVDDEVTR